MKVNMGNKYIFKPDSNPPPGLYDPDRAETLIKPRSQAARMSTEVSPYRRPKEETPSPG